MTDGFVAKFLYFFQSVLCNVKALSVNTESSKIENTKCLMRNELPERENKREKFVKIRHSWSNVIGRPYSQLKVLLACITSVFVGRRPSQLSHTDQFITIVNIGRLKNDKLMILSQDNKLLSSLLDTPNTGIEMF